MTILKTVSRLRVRPLRTGALLRRGLSQVRTIDEPFHEIDAERFRQATDHLKTPVALQRPSSDTSPLYLPAQSKWFAHETREEAFTPYLHDFSYLPFPYELMSPQPTDGGDAVSLFLTWLSKRTSPEEKALYEAVSPLHAALPPPDAPPTFQQLHAPLSLLLAAHTYNATAPHPLGSLYIAQSPIADLPSPLAADLPTPRLVSTAGKGDVYASSIWMGLEPTYTPLHRDPNPNLFVQLRGAKAIRLLPPKRGDALYREVRSAVGGGGSSRLRGADMMGGPERELLHERVWGDGAGVVEATVRAGDAVYVPLGWWHSVRSEGEDGALNASVNWWFR